jgi:hypothetical protein
MTRPRLFAPLLAAVLSGCAVSQPVARFTAADSANATALAKAAAPFDPTAAARIPCWQAWGSLAGAFAQGGRAAGLLSATEASLEADAVLNSPACQAVTAQALFNLVR